PMDEVGSMPTSSIKIERAVNCRLRTYWNYVGRHGADGTHSLPLVDCPVDSRATAKRFRYHNAGILPRWQITTDRLLNNPTLLLPRTECQSNSTHRLPIKCFQPPGRWLFPLCSAHPGG